MSYLMHKLLLLVMFCKLYILLTTRLLYNSVILLLNCVAVVGVLNGNGINVTTFILSLSILSSILLVHNDDDVDVLTLQLIKKNEIVEDDDKQLKLFLHMIKECLEHVRNRFTYAEFCRIHVLCFGVQPFNHPQLPRNCCT